MLPYLALMVLCVGAALGVCVLAAKSGVPSERVNNTTFTLRHGPAFRALVFLILVLLPMAVVMVMLKVKPITMADKAIYGSVILVALLVGGVMAWDAIRFRLEVTPQGLRFRSPWRKTVEMPWANVKAIRFSLVNFWFVITTQSNEVIRVSALVPGVKDFLKLAELQLPPEALQQAKGGYRWVGK